MSHYPNLIHTAMMRCDCLQMEQEQGLQGVLVLLYFCISVAPKGPEWDPGPCPEKVTILGKTKGNWEMDKWTHLPQIIEHIMVEAERESRPRESHPMSWWLIEMNRLLTPKAHCSLLLSLLYSHCSRMFTFRTAYCGLSSRTPWQWEVSSDP